MSLKLIVLGSVNGHFDAAFQKLTALHAKNRFTCCIATGDLFAAEGDADADADAALDRLLSGQIAVPVSTYFTVGTRPFPARVAARLEAAAAENRLDGDSRADGAELCANLTFLGRRSVTKTADGLRLVALGGVEETAGEDHDNDTNSKEPGGEDDHDTNSKAPWRPSHTRADAAVLRGAHHADVLLTALWPRGVWRGSRVALPADAQQQLATAAASSDAVADLAAALRPRYHLTAAPVLAGQSSSSSSSSAPAFFYYEREPFFHPARENSAAVADDVDVTRFLALAPWANPAKAKALYAFALPSGGGATSTAVAALPAGCTPSPFRQQQANPKKRAPLEPAPYSRFATQQGGDASSSHRGGSGKRRRGGADRPPPPGPDQCYFCLANPNLPTHMVCSIGTDAYLATAKGPLPEVATWAADHGGGSSSSSSSGLPFPGHMIIVPLNHAPTLAVAADPAATRATFREMTRFRRALQTMLGRRRLGAVTWEISRQRNVHVHWQTVPVPATLVRGAASGLQKEDGSDNLVAAAFRVEAANLGLPRFDEAQPPAGTGAGGDEEEEDAVFEGDTFRVWIWAPAADGDDGDDKTINGHETALVMRLDPDRRFDLQFGRRVVAKLLGLEATRMVWQECAQTEAEETADVAAFRAAFAPYDFTLEE